MGQRAQGTYRRTEGFRCRVGVLGVDEGEHSGIMYQEYSSRWGITLERQNPRCVEWEYKGIMPVFACRSGKGEGCMLLCGLRLTDQEVGWSVGKMLKQVRAKMGRV